MYSVGSMCPRQVWHCRTPTERLIVYSDHRQEPKRYDWIMRPVAAQGRFTSYWCHTRQARTRSHRWLVHVGVATEFAQGDRNGAVASVRRHDFVSRVGCHGCCPTQCVKGDPRGRTAARTWHGKLDRFGRLWMKVDCGGKFFSTWLSSDASLLKGCKFRHLARDYRTSSCLSVTSGAASQQAISNGCRNYCEDKKGQGSVCINNAAVWGLGSVSQPRLQPNDWNPAIERM